MHSFIAEHSQFMIVFIKTHCNTNMQTNTHKHKHINGCKIKKLL